MESGVYSTHKTHKTLCLLAAFYSQRVVLTSSLAGARFALVETSHLDTGTEQCVILNIT